MSVVLFRKFILRVTRKLDEGDKDSPGVWFVKKAF